MEQHVATIDERAPAAQPEQADQPIDFADWGRQMIAALRAGGRRVVAASFALVALMLAGSAAMWIGLPVAWLWLASHLQSGTNPSIGPYLLVAVGLPTSMVIVAKGLRLLDHAFSQVVGFEEDRRVPLPWLKSMRDARGRARRASVLDLVMIVSVGLAAVALGVWLVFFAGAPPSSVGNGNLHP